MAAINFDAHEAQYKAVLSDTGVNLRTLSQGQTGTVRVEFGDPNTIPPPLDWLPVLFLKLPHEFENAAGALGNIRKPTVFVQVTDFVRLLNPTVRDEYMSQAALRACRSLFAQFELLVRNNFKLDATVTTMLHTRMIGRVSFGPALLSQSEEVKAFDAYQFQAIIESQYIGV